MSSLVYFSSRSGNTERFVKKLAIPAKRIPLNDFLWVVSPFVLICPSYGDNRGIGSVPQQVIHFLNSEGNRSLLRGVIGTGNRNFGQFYAHAADVISAKCGVPVLYRFELAGTSEDVDVVRAIAGKVPGLTC